MKGCIILFGESFRLGGQNSRNIGSDESYNEQINAAKSHISFINHLKESVNVNLNVYLSTYETKFKSDLINVYNDLLIGHDFYDSLIGQGKLIHNAINKINKINKINYDFLLIMRIDLFLKSKFTEIFDHNWDKILWPSICFKPYHKHGIHPRVNDMMVFFPRKYYMYLKYLYPNNECNGHGNWANIIENSDLTYDSLDTMINTFHDSDSAKDFNPLYYIVNRNQCNVHKTNGDLFNKWEI